MTLTRQWHLVLHEGPVIAISRFHHTVAWEPSLAKHGDFEVCVNLNLFRLGVGVVSAFHCTMDGSLASAQQHQLSVGVGGVPHDLSAPVSAQHVPEPATEVNPEESNTKPELPSSEAVQSTADILQVLQKLQAQQSVTPPTPQSASFAPQLEPRPATPILTKEEPQPTPVAVPEEPVTEWDALRASLRENPHDTEGWNKLVRLVEDSGDLEKIKEAYESLLKMYPNTVRNPRSVVNYVLTIVSSGLLK
jgi:hypothetical protein